MIPLEGFRGMLKGNITYRAIQPYHFGWFPTWGALVSSPDKRFW